MSQSQSPNKKQSINLHWIKPGREEIWICDVYSYAGGVRVQCCYVIQHTMPGINIVPKLVNSNDTLSCHWLRKNMIAYQVSALTIMRSHLGFCAAHSPSRVSRAVLLHSIELFRDLGLLTRTSHGGARTKHCASPRCWITRVRIPGPPPG